MKISKLLRHVTLVNEDLCHGQKQVPRGLCASRLMCHPTNWSLRAYYHFSPCQVIVRLEYSYGILEELLTENARLQEGNSSNYKCNSDAQIASVYLDSCTHEKRSQRTCFRGNPLIFISLYCRRNSSWKLNCKVSSDLQYFWFKETWSFSASQLHWISSKSASEHERLESSIDH